MAKLYLRIAGIFSWRIFHILRRLGLTVAGGAAVAAASVTLTGCAVDVGWDPTPPYGWDDTFYDPLSRRVLAAAFNQLPVCQRILRELPLLQRSWQRRIPLLHRRAPVHRKHGILVSALHKRELILSDQYTV